MAEYQPPSRPQPQIQGMSNEQVTQIITELIRTLKEPTDEQKEQKAIELARKKEHARQSQLMAEQELQNRLAVQRACNHRNERYHTWVGQVTGDGNAVAICQQCREDFRWKATEDQLRQGLNLLEYRGLTRDHLLQWEKQHPATGDCVPDRIKLLTRTGKNVAWPA